MVAVRRYVSGDTNPREIVAATSQAIAVGDLLALSSGVAVPFSNVTWNTDLATTQEAAHDAFLGVAMSAKSANVAGSVTFATEGVFEFDCAAAQFAMGGLVGPAKQTGDAIENQKVVTVATENLAIGRAYERWAANTTKLKVAIESRVAHGGVQAMA